jgi:heterotetrameric sarcosine oxidase delta subunit
MLLIPCPHCGERDEREFVYGGRAKKFPTLDNSTHTKTWHQIVHLRENPSSVLRELWYHAAGCECWIEISRHIKTHKISTDDDSVLTEDGH